MYRPQLWIKSETNYIHTDFQMFGVSKVNFLQVYILNWQKLNQTQLGN